MNNFSWADCDDTYKDENMYEKFKNYADRLSNKTAVDQDYETLMNQRKIEIEPLDSPNAWKQVKKKRKKQEKQCFTCKPRDHVQKYIIAKWSHVKFQYDMRGRPLIIATPNKHFVKLSTQNNDYIGEIFKEIERFCKKYNYDSYTLQYDNNSEKERRNDHFMIKIKCDEAKLISNRNKHFKNNKQ